MPIPIQRQSVTSYIEINIEGYALNMTLPKTWSSVIWTWPTATPKQRTFFNWNLMVDLTSMSLLFKSSACDTGVGNLPAKDAKR